MRFKEQGIGLVAASADDREHAVEYAKGMDLDFPLGYGLDPEKVHALTGAYISRQHGIVQPAAFLLKPDRTVAVAVVSSWAIGRLRPEEVFGALYYLGKWRS